MNVSPLVFGKHYWFVIYTTALTYPNNPTEEDKKNTKTLLLYLGKKLPCDACLNNFQLHIEKYPLSDSSLENSNKLLEWVVNINNEVNKTIHKPEVTIEQMKKKYMKMYSDKQCKNNYINYIIILFILTLIIGILTYKLYINK